MARGTGILTFAVAVALGFGAGHVALTVTSSDLRLAKPLSIERELAALQTQAAPAIPKAWPAVFEVYVPDQPAPPPPPKPRLNYDLVGLVANDGPDSWAFVRGPSMEKLVRVGDTLEGGEKVVNIDAQGVWIARSDADDAVQVIGFKASTDTTFAALLGSLPAEPQQAEITMDAFSGRDIRRVLGRAGSVRMVQPEGGSGDKFPQILWVREGQLYDLIGLKRGDTVLRVNGYSVGDPETLANAREIINNTNEFAIEILRGGQPQTITVRIAGNG